MATRCTHQINSITPKDTRMEPAPPEPDWLDMGEKDARKKDHPVWGVLIALILCATVLLAIQMILDYHW